MGTAPLSLAAADRASLTPKPATPAIKISGARLARVVARASWAERYQRAGTILIWPRLSRCNCKTGHHQRMPCPARSDRIVRSGRVGVGTIIVEVQPPFFSHRSVSTASTSGIPALPQIPNRRSRGRRSCRVARPLSAPPIPGLGLHPSRRCRPMTIQGQAPRPALSDGRPSRRGPNQSETHRRERGLRAHKMHARSARSTHVAPPASAIVIRVPGSAACSPSHISMLGMETSSRRHVMENRQGPRAGHQQSTVALPDSLRVVGGLLVEDFVTVRRHTSVASVAFEDKATADFYDR